MRASKESAGQALNAMDRIRSAVYQVQSTVEIDDLKLVTDFIEAAESRLPTEASYEKDRRRQRSRRKAK